MPISVTVRLKNDTGKSASDRLTGDATLTGVGVANEVVYIYEADRLIGTTLADAAGNWIYTPPLADGKHSLKVRQTNSLGETAIASTSFVLDSTPPPVTAALKGAPVATFTTSSFSIAPTGSTFVGPSFTTSGDLNKDGFADIAVGDAATNNVFVAFNNGQGGFSAVSAVATGNVPSAVSIVDVNADGFGDLVVSEAGDNTVSVMLGDGAGAFKRSTFAVGNNPQGIRVIDVSGNGKPDMFVANADDNSMTLYFGDGLGGFTKNTTFAVGLNPVAITAGDINGDGKTDVITSNMGDGTVSVLLGKGAGAFGAATSFDVGTAPVSTSRSDINRDGKVDLVVANSGDASVSILLGDGLGGFQTHSVVKMGSAVFGVTVGDLNGDGSLDIVSGTSLAIGDGTGNFVIKQTGISGFTTDVNNDGKLDLVRAGGVSINTTFGPRGGFISDPTLTGSGDPRAVVRFFENGKQIGSTAAASTGAWSFKPVLADGKHTIVVQETDAIGNVGSATVTFTLDTVLPTPTAVLAKDNGASAVDGLTNDPTIKGKAEAGDRVQLFEGTTLLGTATAAADGTWSITPTLTDGTHTVFVNETDAAGNIAASGNVVFTLDQTAPRVMTLLSPPTTLGLTAQPGYDPGLTFPNWLASGDLNGDGKIDIVSATNTTISVQLGDGLGKLAPVAIVSPTTLFVSQSNYVLADVNGDGKADIINFRGFDTILSGSSEQVFLNDGTGKFSAPIQIVLPLGVPASSLTAGDVNGDKKADLIGVSGGLTMALLGDGTGKFGAAINSSGGSAGALPLLVDANGDGKLDVVTSGFGSGSLTGSRGLFVALNAGAGKFGTAGYVALSPSFSSSSLYGGDVNGDGASDLVAVGFFNGFYTAAAVLGDGTGKFGAATYSIISSQFPVGVVVADVNGDGRADLVSATGQNSIMSVMLSEGSGRFGSAMAIAAGLFPNRLTAADLNGDGKSEIIASANTTSFNGVASYSPITVALNTTGGSVGNITKAAVLTGVGEIGLPVSIFDGATLLGTVNPDAGGTWTLSPTLTEGKHVIQAKQTDAAGNTGVSTLTVTVKTKAGVVTAALANDTGISAADGLTSDATLKGTGGIGETISVFEGATLVGTTLIDKAGNWSFKPTLADGAHKLTVTGGDVAGNVSAPVAVNLTVDTTPPPLIIVPPAINFSLTSGGSLSSGLASMNYMAAADFDGDGKTDIIVADTLSFSILQGDGRGSLTKLSNTVVSTGNFTYYTLGDVNGDGKMDVITCAYLPSHFANVYLNAGGGKFTAPAFGTPVTNFQIATADLNGDGKADIVSQTGKSTFVQLNDGSGNFGSALAYATGGSALSLEPLLVDLNGDSRPDVVGLTSEIVNGMTVYSVYASLNDGTGKLSLSTRRPLGSSHYDMIMTSDIDGDGKADIVALGLVANSATTIMALMGDGVGGFRPSVLTTINSTSSLLAASDLTGDGRADLLLGLNDGSVALMVSDGTGKFGPPVSYGPATYPWVAAAVDIDNDGKADIVLGSSSTFDSGGGVFTTKVSTLLNTTTGAFGNMVKAGSVKGTAEIGRPVTVYEGAKLLGTATPDAKTGAWSLAPLLTNGKHTLIAKQTDAAGNTETSTLTILVKTKASIMTAVLANDTGKSAIDKITSDPTIKGTGGAGDAISIFAGANQVATGTVKLDGTWSIRPNLADGAHTLTIKDTDGAGNVSLAATVTMTLDTTAPPLTVNPLTTLGFAAPALTKNDLSFQSLLAAADMDGDGKIDIVTASSTTLSTLPGKGGATFGNGKIFTLGTGVFASRTLLADMNGDGKQDVVAVYSGGTAATMKTYLNDGVGNFGAAISTSLATTSTSVFANDINGDGKADLLSASGTGQVVVQLNDGSAGFSGFSKFSLGNNTANQIILTDLNKDGRQDIVAFSSFSPAITTLLNDGSGVFGAASPLVTVPFSTTQMISSDTNNDGNIDLVAFSGSTFYTVLGDGNGKFSAPITSKIANTANELSAIADINGDNRPDLILSQRGGGGLSVHLGDGAGGFENAEIILFGNGSYMYQAITADMNGDGKPDLVTATNASNGQTQVMLNTTTGPFGYVIAAPTLTGKSELGSKVIISEGAKTVGTAAQGPTGDWSFKASGLTVGGHTLTVTQTDLAGNVSSFPVTITVPPPPGPSAARAAAPADVHVVGGGDVTLDPTLTNVTVLLDSATNLTLNKMGFITAIGSAKGDTITAGAANQTLAGRVGSDTLIGYSGFGTTFRDTSAGLNGDRIGLFGGDDVINVTDLLPGSAQPLVYKTTASGGILTATDGAHTTNIGFIGSYAASDFKLGADGQGGSSITFARGS